MLIVTNLDLLQKEVQSLFLDKQMLEIINSVSIVNGVEDFILVLHYWEQEMEDPLLPHGQVLWL